MRGIMDFPFAINNHVLIASEMMQMRLNVNRENFETLKAACYEEHAKCKDEVVTLAGKPIDVGSPTQVAKFLYGELKLKPKFNRKTNKPTTDENAIRELRVEYPKHKELLNALIKERHIKKKIESYIEIQFDEDGLIGYSANPAGTETNRWSFSKSPRDRGFNVQTAPKVIRLAIEAPAGRVFIAPDLPQADARIVAWDAECEKLIQLFLNPKVHFHLENCIRMGAVPGSPFAGITREIAYGVDENGNAWKDKDPRYTTGKAMGHAANYRMAARRLAMELGISPKDAQTILDIYLHQLYPQIERWQSGLKERVKKCGYLETPFPFLRRRTFYGAWGEQVNRFKIENTTWNEMCAHIPQSAVADIINTGMEKLWKEYPHVRFHKHDHDSFLASVPTARLGECAQLALDALRVELVLHSRPLTMTPEMQYGTNYGALVEWKGEAEPDFAKLKATEAKKLDPAKLRKDLYGYY
jgi:DNA polymerase I-like protein with 3'-5' exonuclease and polymerase domains